MPGLNIFENDVFSLQSMTAAINEMPYTPGYIGSLGLFNERPVSTTSVSIESQSNALGLVQTSRRGAPGVVIGADKRKMRSFIVPHLQMNDEILADEIQGVREFGGESGLQTIERVVNDRLAKGARYLDATLEWHMLGAIKGVILDADNSTTIYNLFTEFGISQNTVAMAIPTATTNINGKCTDILEAIENELGASPVSSVRVICGANFWREFTNHPLVKEKYINSTNAIRLSGDPRMQFEFGGITWERYRGSVGGTAFVATDEAYAIPEGVPDLFLTHYAPADYVDTVNTLGLARYARQIMKPNQKGIDLEVQSNPLCICTRPRAVIKLTKV